MNIRSVDNVYGFSNIQDMSNMNTQKVFTETITNKNTMNSLKLDNLTNFKVCIVMLFYDVTHIIY